MHVGASKQQQVLCCIHGRSHIIKALDQGLYRLLCTSAGKNSEICKILIVAPTGKAA